MAAGYELAMFPLESPILPGQRVPLRIFEPRYRRLAEDLQGADEPEFGVVGIARGREVGGDDARTDVGVVARVVRADQHADGRWTLQAIGTRRIRVDEWLADSPYPRARVTDWPDRVGHDLGPAVADLHAAVVELADSASRHRPDLEITVPELPDDPGRALWPLIGFAGLGPLDLQQLLSMPDAASRAKRARDLIDDRRRMLDALAPD